MLQISKKTIFFSALFFLSISSTRGTKNTHPCVRPNASYTSADTDRTL